jgi:hypothetical protein
MREITNFTTFYEAVKDSKLSIKTAYRLTKLTKAIENELGFYREKLQAIIKQYAQLDEEGKPIPTDDGAGVILRPETEADCYAAIYELQDIEVELPDIKFTFDEFEGTQLTIAQINTAMNFFEEE